MSTVLLEETIGFWDVIWWMLIVFFWTMVIWMFIWTFVDIFRRHDLAGWAKAGWALAILVLPLLGILLYIAFRPSGTAADTQMSLVQPMPGPTTTSDEIARAHELLKKGAITEGEFNSIKARALA